MNMMKNLKSGVSSELKAMSAAEDENGDGDMSMEETKNGLREIFIYFVFIILFTSVLYTQPISDSYYFSGKLKEYFLGAEMDPNYSQVFAKVYDDVLTEYDVWEWLKQPLITNIWTSENGEDNGMILGHDMVIGAMRIEQMSGSLNEGCDIPAIYKDSGIIDTCVSKGLKHKSLSPEKYFTIPNNLPQSEALAILQQKREEGWIDKGTRQVVVRFTVFNPNLDLFCNIQIVFHAGIEGGWSPGWSERESYDSRTLPFSTRFRTVALFRHLLILTKSSALFTPSAANVLEIIVEFVVVIFVFYFYYREGRQMYTAGRRYWLDIWNIYDCVNLAVFGIVILFKLGVMMLLTNLDFNPPADKYEDFQQPAYWVYSIQNWNSLNVVLTYLKLFKYLRLSPSLSQLNRTMGKAAADISIVVIYLIFLFLGYTFAFHMAFGMDIYGFHNISSSFFQLFNWFLGDFDLTELFRYNSLLGGTLFVSFICIMLFVALNMTLAIIDDSYGKVKEETPGEDLFMKQVGMFVTSVLRRKQQNVQQMQDRLSAALDDGTVAFDELKTMLKGNPEAAAIFAEYDLDGDGNLTDDEIQAMMAKLDQDGGGTLEREELNLIKEKLMAAHDKLANELEEKKQEEEARKASRPMSPMPAVDINQQLDQMLSSIMNLQVAVGNANSVLDRVEQPKGPQ